MNWEKKNDRLAAVMAGQKNKVQKIRELLFGPKPARLPPKKAKPKNYRWTGTYTFDSYGNARYTQVRRYNGTTLDKGYKTFESATGFKKALVRRGYERLGGGSFSTVYAKPGSDRVIKVTHRPDNWIDYCLWGEKEGYAGSLSPKVYSFKVFNKGQHFSVSVVERMKRDCGRIGRKEDLYVLGDLLYRYVHSENTMCGLFLEELAPGMADFCLKLKKNFGELDLHGGNIMVRDNGSVCVTDPVTYMDGELKPKSYVRLKAKDITSLAKAIERCLCLIVQLKQPDNSGERNILK